MHLLLKSSIFVPVNEMKKLLVLLLLLSSVFIFSCSTTADSVQNGDVPSLIDVSMEDEGAVSDILPETDKTAETEQGDVDVSVDDTAETVEEIMDAVPDEEVQGEASEGEKTVEETPQEEDDAPEEGLVEASAVTVTEESVEGEPSEEWLNEEEAPSETSEDAFRDEIISSPEGNNPLPEEVAVNENITDFDVTPSSRTSTLEYFLIGLCIFIFVLIVILLIIIIRKPEWYKKKDK